MPEMPLTDVAGNIGAAAPAHIFSDEPKLNAGIAGAFMVTAKVTVVAHCPADGVKV